MSNPSDRPPPYIPKWGQDLDQPDGSRPAVQNDPFGFNAAAGEDRAWHYTEGDRLPPSRALDPEPVPEWPRQGARANPRRQGLMRKLIGFSLTFGLAAVATLVVVLMLNQPASQTQPRQAVADASFTTRFKVESEPQPSVAAAAASRDRAAAPAPQVAGIARAPAREAPARAESPASNLTAVPRMPAPGPTPAPPVAAPAPQPTAQPQPPAPPLSTLGRAEIDILFKQGEDFVAVGDLASARVVFRRAAEARDPRAALALGATYDPILLARMGARGITPDVAMAREWYTRAREYGSFEAAGRLQALANAR